MSAVYSKHLEGSSERETQAEKSTSSSLLCENAAVPISVSRAGSFIDLMHQLNKAEPFMPITVSGRFISVSAVQPWNAEAPICVSSAGSSSSASEAQP